MSNSKKLSKEEIGEIFYKLSLAVSKTKKVDEAVALLRDLLSIKEVEMIAKRLKIAELLLDNHSYEDIREALGVGYGTISRVQEWLNISGDGYRLAVNRVKNKGFDFENDCPVVDLNSIKKRYPMYYWPEIVLENIVKNSNKKQKDKLRRVITEMDKMKEKNELFRKLKNLIK
ncbi:MAG: YerC/YecD family TrpR-related protein [Candidatus Moranbacteria bacterium]|nr:YerC/YecD family TrpR-related protein [Candidatus Moranbacteria bacterium]